jgi:hypothetical protein
MARSKSRPGQYYYAAGRRVALIPDDEWLALDTAQFEPAGTPQGVRTAAIEGARRLLGDWILVPTASLPALDRQGLAKHGGVQPVYRAKGAIIVALPEVRVEEGSTDRRKSIQEWVRTHRDRVELVNEDGPQILLRPKSGNGADAIAIANQLTEQVGPEMAQPRFLRIVDRPGAAERKQRGV